MTIEEKQLLLQDLCARLPYRVKIELTWWVMGEGTYINTTLEPDHIEQLLNDEDGDTEIKPYLRPLSSMTEEEKRELQSFFPGSFGGQWLNLEKGYIDIYECEPTIRLYLYDATGLTEWLNKKMFDYRGLIPKGLAEIAPEGMYNN